MLGAGWQPAGPEWRELILIHFLVMLVSNIYGKLNNISSLLPQTTCLGKSVGRDIWAGYFLAFSAFSIFLNKNHQKIAIFNKTYMSLLMMKTRQLRRELSLSPAWQRVSLVFITEASYQILLINCILPYIRTSPQMTIQGQFYLQAREEEL